MVSIKVVLLTEPDANAPDLSTASKSHQQLLAKKIENVVNELTYKFETVEFSKLQFQEQESVDKFLSANIVIMVRRLDENFDVTNESSRPTIVYFKSNRESMGCTDDIILIQASGLEDSSAIQDLKTTCKIKNLITYRYNEQKDRFFDTSNALNHRLVSFRESLRDYLKQSAEAIQEGLADRYITLLEQRTNKNDDKDVQSKYLWDIICEDFLQERNHRFATPKLIIQLMYAFRDIQDYESMIKFIERCEQFEEIGKHIKNNRMISYLTAFARSRRNQGDDQDKALEILERLCQTNRMETDLTNDITCLIGRIYKDKYTVSNCEDNHALEKAIEWYRRGFADEPNIYAGINLLCLLAVKIDDLHKNLETYRIIIQLNALLGKRGRQLKDLNDYWEVATYFELHSVQNDWPKACQAALHMYLVNPPIWYLKSTLNNLTILHHARQIRRNRTLLSTEVSTENPIYSFWMEFFCDAIDSSSPEQREIPNQVPILICDNYAKNDGSKYETIFLEAYLQLNFHTSNGPATIIIRILDRPELRGQRDLVKSIEINSIRSIIDVKRDTRSIFFYAHENSETFSAIELQICFPSAERRTAFNEKMSQYHLPSPTPSIKENFELEFALNSYGERVTLGRGTFGCVYLAKDRRTRQKFAVKEIPMRCPAYTEILQNEVQISSTLHHKNIVNYYGSAIDSTRKPPMFQVFMEYIDGGNLSKVISSSGKFSEKSIQIYTRQILEGLQYLHERHILHRDIKSANILLNSHGDIKIVDFGTSKRLAGLHLCTEANIGTSHYMSPDVIAVSPMGYGPEVDIWSVGCTVIEMATGKRPFATITNHYAMQHKLANERTIPEIPKELSEDAQDFLAKCFEPKATRPSAKTLLAHPFLRKKFETDRDSNHSNAHETLTNGTAHACILQKSPSKSDDDDDRNLDHYEPAPNGNGEISVDNLRRSKLAKLFHTEEYRTKLIGNWMGLIEEKSQTELLDIDKLVILLNAICDHLDEPNNLDCLKNALNQICDLSKMDVESRMDLERSVYLFIKAVNVIFTQERSFAPHVSFALDNTIRRIAEYLVGCIRTDFVPAVTATPSILRSDSNQTFFTQWSGGDRWSTDENSVLNQKYLSLTEQNREKIRQLIEVEKQNKDFLSHLPDQNGDTNLSLSSIQSSSSPLLRSVSIDRPKFIFPNSVEQVNNQSETSPSVTSRGIKRTRSLMELEEEYDRLLKGLVENRHRVKEILSSQSSQISSNP